LRAQLFRAVFVAVAIAAAGIASASAQPRAGDTQAGPSEYRVFFDFGSARLGPLARRIVADAAQAARQRQAEGSFSHVKVIGYADTAGSAGGSQRLSEERAQAVRDELVRLGLPGDAVRTEGRGKEDLAVATGDKVREPRNRRARLVIYRPGE